MKRRRFLQASLAAALPAVAWPVRAPRRLQLVERWSWAMGQPVRVVLYHQSETDGLEAAQAVLEEIRRVEGHLSRFEDASDLQELNRQAGRGAVRVDRDLLAVLRAAGRFRDATSGAFDVAVEPLMRLWGFREPRRSPPDAAEWREAREAVRSAVVTIDADRVTLPAAHTRLDLGGIGVGYALDRAALVLGAHGVERALVDISGDLLALGPPPGRPGWPVDVADPRVAGGRVGTIALRHEALATSANTVSVTRQGGELRGHVMDPARGVPAERLLQATVVAGSGIEADALSTAMLVAGRPWTGIRRAWSVTRPPAHAG